MSSKYDIPSSQIAETSNTMGDITKRGTHLPSWPGCTFSGSECYGGAQPHYLPRLWQYQLHSAPVAGRPVPCVFRQVSICVVP